MSICLSEEEIRELTRKRQHGAQARELRLLGIPCRLRSDGSLIVLRVHVEVEQARSSSPEPQLRLNS
jgi:hypothetical protein